MNHEIARLLSCALDMVDQVVTAGCAEALVRAWLAAPAGRLSPCWYPQEEERRRTERRAGRALGECQRRCPAVDTAKSPRT
jgi:hypothetical protein